MKPPSFLRAGFVAAAASCLLPWLASAHPGHDHSDIPSVIRHPLAGVEHVVLVATVLIVVTGAWLMARKASRASTDHGARPRTIRVR